MIKLMGEHMSRGEIDAIVKEADDNGDGTVDFEGAACFSTTLMLNFASEVVMSDIDRTAN